MSDNEPSENVEVVVTEEADDFRAMLIGATVVFVLSFIPYVRMTCCLPHLLGALVAVYLFTRQYGLTLSYGRGVRLGILTCLLGGLAAWAVGILIWLTMDVQVGAKEGEALSLWMAEKFGGEQGVKAAREAMAAQAAEGVTLKAVLIGVVVVSLLATISGMIGGSLGALLFRRGPAPGARGS